jgi:hypothetical protein
LIGVIGSDFPELSLLENVHFEAVSLDRVCEFTRFISPFFEVIANANAYMAKNAFKGRLGDR